MNGPTPQRWLYLAAAPRFSRTCGQYQRARREGTCSPGLHLCFPLGWSLGCHLLGLLACLASRQVRGSVCSLLLHLPTYSMDVIALACSVVPVGGSAVDAGGATSVRPISGCISGHIPRCIQQPSAQSPPVLAAFQFLTDLPPACLCSCSFLCACPCGQSWCTTLCILQVRHPFYFPAAQCPSLNLGLPALPALTPLLTWLSATPAVTCRLTRGACCAPSF